MSLPGVLKTVDRDHPCDRCRHPLRDHASPALWSICMVGRRVSAKRGVQTVSARFCACDGYVAAP